MKNKSLEKLLIQLSKNLFGKCEIRSVHESRNAKYLIQRLLKVWKRAKSRILAHSNFTLQNYVFKLVRIQPKHYQLVYRKLKGDRISNFQTIAVFSH